MALVSMKTIAMALLIAAAAFAPADRASDLQQAVSRTLEQDRTVDQGAAEARASNAETGQLKAEPAPTIDPAGMAGAGGNPSPRPLPPTDTLP